MAEAEYWRFTVARDCQKKNTSENHSHIRLQSRPTDCATKTESEPWDDGALLALQSTRGPCEGDLARAGHALAVQAPMFRRHQTASAPELTLSDGSCSDHRSG
jgi:hypothetical protein